MTVVRSAAEEQAESIQKLQSILSQFRSTFESGSL